MKLSLVSLAQFCSVLCLSMGLVGILGYVLQQESLLTLGTGVHPIALAAAIAALTGGIAIFILCWLFVAHAGHDLEVSPLEKPLPDREVSLHPLPLEAGSTRFGAADLVALVTLIGCFAILLVRPTEVAAAMIVTVVAYYFGRAVVTGKNNQNGQSSALQQKGKLPPQDPNGGKTV